MNETITITRRNRIETVISYSPGPVGESARWQNMTPRQIITEYREYRHGNPNAAVFVHLRKNGQMLQPVDSRRALEELVDGWEDAVELSVIS